MSKKRSSVKLPAIKQDRSFFQNSEWIMFGIFFLFLFLAFSTSIQVNFTIPKLVILRCGAAVIFSYFLATALAGKLGKIPFLVLYTLLAMMVWFLISTICASHLSTALHGYYGRYNGFLNQLLYGGLFLAIACRLRISQDTDRILAVFIASLVPVAVYAIMQYLHLDPLAWPIDARPASTIGNPVILGAIISMALPFCFYFLLGSKTKLWRTFSGSALVLFVTALGMTLSRGPWIAAATAVAIMIFMSLQTPDKRHVKSVCLSLGVAVLAITIILATSGLGKEIRQRVTTLFNPATERSLNQRSVYINTAINMIKDRPIIGSGFETYHNLYPVFRPANEHQLNAAPTMAHSGYVQMAQSTGIPGLLLYLAFVAAVYLHLAATYKSTQEKQKKLLLGAFIASLTAYLIQDISGWPEIALTPVFWMIAGLGMAAAHQENGNGIIKGKTRTVAIAAASLGIAYALILTGDGILRWKADSNYLQSQTANPRTESVLIESRLLSAVELMPSESQYSFETGMFYFQKYCTTMDNDAYYQGLQMFKQAHAANPYERNILINALGQDSLAMYRGLISEPSQLTAIAIQQLSSKGANNPDELIALAKYEMGRRQTQQAELLLKKALSIDPKNLVGLINSGEFYSHLHRYPQALEMFSQVISILDKIDKTYPMWVHAHLSSISILFTQKKYDEALREVDLVLASLPTDVNALQMRGSILVAKGNLPKAEESYLEALRLDPRNPMTLGALEKLKTLGLNK